MAIRALDLTSVVRYVCKEDVGDGPTVWVLAPLTSRDLGRIRDSATDVRVIPASDPGEEPEIVTSISRSRMNFEAVRLSLQAVENFADHNGEPVELERERREVHGATRLVAPESFLSRVPLRVVTELAERILADNEPTPTELGN